MTIIRVVGIDPGFANTGLVAADVCTSTRAIVELVEMRLITTKAIAAGKSSMRKANDDIGRARQAVTSIRSFIAKHDPKVAFTELMDWGATGKRTVFAFGICYGMIAGIERPQVIEMTPEDLRLAAGLTKGASKPDMIRWASSRFPDAEWKYAKEEGSQTIAHPDGVRHLHKDNEHMADGIAAIQAGLLSPTMIAVMDILS